MTADSPDSPDDTDIPMGAPEQFLFIRVVLKEMAVAFPNLTTQIRSRYARFP
jgi:hypothetical protein